MFDSRLARPARALLALLTLGGSLSCASCGPEDGGPVRVSPAQYDFGDVLHGRHLRKVFTIENLSDRTITITMTQPNCACFRVDQPPRNRLDPGEQTEFEVVLESDAIPPQRIRGKYLMVGTDHPGAALTRVPLEGTIFSPLYTEPRDALAFGMASEHPESRAPRTIKVRGEGGYQIRLDRTVPDWPDGFQVTKPQWFDVEIEELEKGLDVHVRLRESAVAAAGRYREYLNIALKVSGPRMDGEALFKGFRLEGQFPTHPVVAVRNPENPDR